MARQAGNHSVNSARLLARLQRGSLYFMKCPICQSPVRTWYSLVLGISQCVCANPACVLQQKSVTGSGYTTGEAEDRFLGLALKFEQPKTLKKTKDPQQSLL